MWASEVHEMSLVSLGSSNSNPHSVKHCLELCEDLLIYRY